MAPFWHTLRQVYLGRVEVSSACSALLDQLRDLADYAQGYGPANLMSLLRVQRGHLRGLDLSHLAIRGASSARGRDAGCLACPGHTSQ